jgi:hypothetical protein
MIFERIQTGGGQSYLLGCGRAPGRACDLAGQGISPFPRLILVIRPLTSPP